jgi:hypothetical protein
MLEALRIRLEALPKPCSVSALAPDAICACKLPSSLVMRRMSPWARVKKRALSGVLADI